MAHLIEIQDLVKTFDGVNVLDHVNLYIDQKEFVTLLGPSGCGKTTLLRTLAGFCQPDSGRIFFSGQDILTIPPYRRKVNTVFQKYALFPHLNVYENIAFGLTIQKADKKVIERKVGEMLELVNLTGFEKRQVERLSGGQQQRVAIARALVNEPEVLLLDEPLGALDLKLRKGMQTELKNMQQQLGITFLFVTHDQEEALTMSDTIVVLKDGRIQQIGKPIDIYNEPKNAYVADFIGESNILSGTMFRDRYVAFSGAEFDCLDGGFAPREEVDVVVRPEDVKLSETCGQLSGVVLSTLFKGVHYEMKMQVGDKVWLAHSTREVQPGRRVKIHLEPDDIHIMKKMEGGQ